MAPSTQDDSSSIPRRFLVLSNQEDEELQAALDLAEVALGETNVDDAPDKFDNTVNNSARLMPSGCVPTATAALIISCSAPHNERSHVISASRSRTLCSMRWWRELRLLLTASATRSARVFRQVPKRGPNGTLPLRPYIFDPTFSTHLSISLCWIIEAAAMVVITLSNGVGGASDWPDHLGIVLLLLARATITIRTSPAALIDSLAPKVKAKRNEQLAIDRTKLSRET